MFITELKTALVQALKLTFDAEYVEDDFRNLHVSIEYPMKRQDYPGLWVDFDTEGQLENIGIDHREYATVSEGEGTTRRVMRWRFQGYASFTVVAMTSLERDRLLDEVIRVIAFGTESEQTSQFRAFIEDNDFLALNIDFDQIGISGVAAVPGTPWGSDEVIYEVTVRVEVVGEFVSDNSSQTLVPLEAIVVYPYTDETQPVPAAVATPSGLPGDEPDLQPGDTDGWR